LADRKPPAIELTVNGIPMDLVPRSEPAPTQIEPAPPMQPAAPPVTKTPGDRYKPRGYLLSLMGPDEWIGVTDLAERAGMLPQNVAATLYYWGKKGLVENRDRKWRKIGEIK
jgi:hypothetical protein